LTDQIRSDRGNIQHNSNNMMHSQLSLPHAI